MNIDLVFSEFPILESDNIILTKIEDIHLEELYGIYSDDHVFEYCGIIPKSNKATVKNMISHFERDFNKQSRIKWGIFHKSEPQKLVGIMEAFDFNQRVNMVTIGYFLARTQWGRGIATEAVSLAIFFLFNLVRVNRIQAEVMLQNDSSKKVLLKNDFVHEGTLRQASVWSGKGIVDLEIYGLLSEDYKQ
ncbi:GNAT family N-acetyltransferase [Paenibacillus paeoniae]|uniref:N-acetyltransferase n=1 Tax=Paenibacillus paeoniae TaxID=2292705 RepID=A0A371PKV1_9BACL|nr:GNAT family protein [Paenibacillus paeoniae]REK76831.1 N-acetyltransferase [Paenibacillus paeoniae]